MMTPPVKPFQDYKWRWAALQPTEGLNEPAVFLGVLRAMARFEGRNLNDPAFIRSLGTVQRETGTDVNLTRTGDRNIIRNSGQYWKALNLIGDAHGTIQLTEFGKMVADGRITTPEFSAVILKTLELPNLRIERNPEEWGQNRLRIKPLELLLNILGELRRRRVPDGSYITRDELVKVIIPLAGCNTSVNGHVDAVLEFRRDASYVSEWPNCVLGANDTRMAREFLLFLTHYDFCRLEDVRGEARFYLDVPELAEIEDLSEIEIESQDPAQVSQEIRSEIVRHVERRRVAVEITARPGQREFRNAVMTAYESRCVMTGTDFKPALEAAHIVPVNQRGSDDVSNGLCLRADIHILFDGKHLMIDADGNVSMSDSLSESQTYRDLPMHIDIPDFVNREHLRRRRDYT